MDSTRRGFTLIEVLVVICLVAILLGLLLPSIQGVRESASRMVCQNNCRQIGLGLINYCAKDGVFPPGYRTEKGKEQGPGWGWATYTLPYLELSESQNIHLDKSLLDSVNSEGRVLRLKTFLCPSDEPQDLVVVTQLDPLLTTDLAPASYVGVFGNQKLLDNTIGDGDGVLFRDSKVKVIDITDGTGNTIVVGERNSQLGRATWVGVVPGKVALFPERKTDNEQIGPALVLGTTGSSNDDPPHVPNSPACGPDNFGSRHKGGANFVFADGSVRFLSSNINPSTWWNLGRRASGGNKEIRED